jgi:hypothetical protein
MMPAMIIIEIAGRLIPLTSGKMKIKDNFFYILKMLLNSITVVFNHKQSNANMLHSIMFVKTLETAERVRDEMTGTAAL